MDTDRRALGEYSLAIYRILVGWIFLWPFFDKLIGLGFQTPGPDGMVDGGSPSSFVTYVADGYFADFYISAGGNLFVDVLIMVCSHRIFCSFLVPDGTTSDNHTPCQSSLPRSVINDVIQLR